MLLKASLHIHSGADLTEGREIGYSVFELIERAHTAGIDVLAHTCHEFFVWDEAWADYARRCGILLIPGVELKIKEGGSNNHVVIVNCDSSIASVKTFTDLENYKAEHPEILVIAAHPNFGIGESLGLERLEKYRDLFDAIENAWFYTNWFNPNKPVEEFAREKNIPYLATADLHHFNFSCLKTDYIVTDVDEFTAEAVVQAVKNGRFKNVTAPKSVWLLITAGWAVFLLVVKGKWKKWSNN
jgi:predicted metal-dependent phosphoesterase TrpH